MKMTDLMNKKKRKKGERTRKRDRYDGLLDGNKPQERIRDKDQEARWDMVEGRWKAVRVREVNRSMRHLDG